MPCEPRLSVPNVTAGVSLTSPAPPVIPSFGLLCCHTPTITLPLPQVSVSATVTAAIADVVEPALDAAMVYFRKLDLPCLKDPPPTDEL